MGLTGALAAASESGMGLRRTWKSCAGETLTGAGRGTGWGVVLQLPQLSSSSSFPQGFPLLRVDGLWDGVRGRRRILGAGGGAGARPEAGVTGVKRPGGWGERTFSLALATSIWSCLKATTAGS